MYILVTLSDVVQIKPEDFSKPSDRAIEDWINDKYADKVLHKTGLCVGFHSLISSSEGLIGQTGSGIVNVNVDFRLIVFRPFKGEILQGTITDSKARGVQMNMDFFDDIIVPPSVLFEPTVWQTDEGGQSLWVWKHFLPDPDGVENNPETGEKGTTADYYYDRAEKCFFRVEQEEWNDLSPKQSKPQGAVASGDNKGDKGEDEQIEVRLAPYSIQASMMHTGLGPKLWWTGEEELAEAQETNGTDGVDGEMGDA